MKWHPVQIVGKKISGIVVAEGPDTPKTQIFLAFQGGTYYEFTWSFDHIVEVLRASEGALRHMVVGMPDDLESNDGPPIWERVRYEPICRVVFRNRFGLNDVIPNPARKLAFGLLHEILGATIRGVINEPRTERQHRLVVLLDTSRYFEVVSPADGCDGTKHVYFGGRAEVAWWAGQKTVLYEDFVEDTGDVVARNDR